MTISVDTKHLQKFLFFQSKRAREEKSLLFKALWDIHLTTSLPDPSSLPTNPWG